MGPNDHVYLTVREGQHVRVVLLLAVVIEAAFCEKAQHPAPQPQRGEAHQDHEPKHGGTFFMAMDSHHHLEGVLEAPGVFRVYLYDSHTEPLAPDQMKQAGGKVLVGESDNPPEVALQLSSDGKTLETALGGKAGLPVTLTLLLRFPGMALDARPELFTFPFREYSKPTVAQ